MEFAQDIRADETIQPYLSAATRQASQRGRPIRLQTDNYIAFADAHRWTSVQEKSRKILELIRSKSSFFSQTVPLNPECDYPLFDAISSVECVALINTLFAKGLISHHTSTSPNDWCLTMEGWESVEPLRTGGIPGRCFVAMAFESDLDLAYFEGIKPAVIEAGYEPV